MKIYGYFRSSASYRVRIALNLKGLAPDFESVHFHKDGGQQFSETFRRLNPQSLVPVLEDNGEILTQSLAIIEYLDETRGGMQLLPTDPLGRARVRSLSQLIACDIHPLNNLKVLKYLTGTLQLSEEQKLAWYRHWTESGLAALEARLAKDRATGTFCHGDAPTMADCCLVPQVFNARRFECDMQPFPTVLHIYDNCQAMEAFRQAAPGVQPDAE
jgi:maleylpyruvate isomerase